MTNKRTCLTCGGVLSFVAVEVSGDTSWLCTECGDEWLQSSVVTPPEPRAVDLHEACIRASAMTDDSPVPPAGSWSQASTLCEWCLRPYADDEPECLLDHHDEDGMKADIVLALRAEIERLRAERDVLRAEIDAALQADSDTTESGE